MFLTWFMSMDTNMKQGYVSAKTEVSAFTQDFKRKKTFMDTVGILN